MSVEFDTPANRIIAQQQPKNQFRVNTTLPDITFLRQMSVQGRLRYITGGTITPTNGETFFCYAIYATNTDASNTRVLTVVNDGTTRFSLTLAALAGVEITNFMDSLVGDGTKTFTASGTNITITFLGWVENTARIRDVTT